LTTPSEPLVVAHNLGKRYALSHGGAGGLRALIAAFRRVPTGAAYVALEDVSFSVRRGESLAIIGENGAGKSTLLKMIAAVVKPSAGNVVVNGSISALLELGSGFHPEYTGLQNIDLSAALLGIAPDELAAKRDEIIAFADIGDAVHKPIKTYSSGMVVRLGFAIATAVNPDLLITDEVMAVGDEAFQKKCIRWVEGYLSRGGTLLLVSHSMYHVQKLCSHAIWLERGRVRAAGDAMTISQAYLAASQEKEALNNAASAPKAVAVSEHGYYAVQELLLNGAATAPVLQQGDDLAISGRVNSPDGRTPHIVIGLIRTDQSPVYGTGSELDGITLKQIEPNVFGFSLNYPQLAVLPGRYIVRAHAMDPEGMRLFDTVEATFTVAGSSRELGVVRLPHRWE
jgi:lipopolysaccharide transport system ATP-binding protein